MRKSLEALSTLLIPTTQGSQVKEPEHRSETPPETNKNDDSQLKSYS